MQAKIPAIFILALAIGSILGLSACSGGSSSGTATVTSISISPTAVSVQINTTAQFTATVNLSNTTTATTSTAVTWLVNGVAGGNSTVGTIVASSTDVQVGIYTAPAIVPSTNNGQVNITATAPENPGSTSTTTGTTITSNTAVVTIGIGQGLAVTPLTTTVPAGGSHQFSATLNSVADGNATWAVSSANGGALGSIDAHSGSYTAPAFPPPGETVTITAQDGTATATATAQIVYSDVSLNGPFAFSYTGNDASGLTSVAGRFVSDGAGHIVSGIEDVTSFLNGITSQVPISGTYTVSPDGRGIASISSSRGVAAWEFVMTTNQHAVMTRFDSGVTGGGTIDQQNLNALTNTLPATLLSGPYVFSVSGMDVLFKPEALAGRFTADGAGSIPQSASILDANDGGTVTTGDTTLHGTYAFDAGNPGTGRGTLTLNSNTTNQLQYAFYLIDGTHLHIVETDGNAFLAGEVYSGASGAFSNASLASGNYVFTSSGTSNTGGTSAGAFAAGGVFASGGNGNVTGGTLDTNNAGTVAANATVATCAYSVDATTGRIDIKLFTGSGSCPGTPSTSVKEFVAYQTAAGPAMLVQLDAAAVSTGMAYPQSATLTAPVGEFAVALTGSGIFHNNSSRFQPVAAGEITLSGAAITAGFLDINNFNAVFQTDPISTAGSSIATAGSNGRGTAVIEGTNPDVTYKLIYYLIDANTALVFDQDTTRIATGTINRQF